MTRLSEAGADALLSGAEAGAFFGPAFDRLLARRVIEEQAPLSDWDVCDGCDCGLPGRPIRADGDRLRADCPFDPRQDVILSEDDLRTFRIGPTALAREIAAALGREPAEAAGGIWHLGVAESGRAVFLVLARAAALRDGLVPILRQVARGAAITLLGPELPRPDVMRLEDADIHHVVTATALDTGPAGIGATIARERLEPGSSPPALVYRASAGRVEVHGRAITLSHQLAPVFRRLVEKARTRDPVVSSPALEGETGREAKDLVRELRAAFVVGGLSDREARELIVNVRGRGWRIGLDAAEVLLAG